MADAYISLPVDPDTARMYNEASDEDRLRIQVLLRLYLGTWLTRPGRSLNEIMDQIGAEAQARGLTPEILEDILRDE